MSLSNRKQSVQNNAPYSPTTNAILCNDPNNEIEERITDNQQTLVFETCQDWFIIYSWNYPILSNLLVTFLKIALCTSLRVRVLDRRQIYCSFSNAIEVRLMNYQEKLFVFIAGQNGYFSLGKGNQSKRRKNFEFKTNSSFTMGIRNNEYTFCWEVRPCKKQCPDYYTKLHLTARLQF